MTRLVLLLLLLIPGVAAAQTATLVADRLVIEADSTLVAEGNVEVFYGDTRLEAPRITFDGATERLTVEGPLRITEPGADTVLLADQAALDPRLRSGILRSARIVLDQQLQIAADEVARIGGRYTQLTGAVASSCRVCSTSATPLWEIRASRVLHDAETRQIYFDQARFRVLGVPVMYIPRLRMPDPTVERARGFLVPQLRQSSRLGTGIRIPYFVPLGRSADLTFSPLLTGKTRTLEARYRQAFRRGSLTFTGSASRDDFGPDDLRGHLFGSGTFRLPQDFRVSFGVELTSDDSYLRDYGYTSASRLDSGVSLSRVRREELVSASATQYEILRPGSLRDGDENLVELGQLEYERWIDTPAGDLVLRFDATTVGRDTDVPIEGRDVARFGASVGWSRSELLPGGVVLDGHARLRADSFRISRDPRFEDEVTRISPAVSAALRWPLSRGSPKAFELIEPVVQLAWAETHGGAVPNEDSRLVELDAGNLLSLDRYAGYDRIETGPRLNLGVAYTRLDSRGWQFHANVGRILRFDDEDQFPEGSGLRGRWSDWLISTQVALGDRLTVTSRALLDGSLDPTRNELRLAYDAGRAEFAGTYLWLDEDAAESRPFDVHEATLDASWRISRHWSGAIEGRYDFEVDRTSAAGLAMTYRTECLEVDFSLSRDFDSAGSVDPEMEYRLQVSLAGFGDRDGARYRRTCSG